MLPNILKETVRGIQPILIEDEMLQHREVFLIEEVNRKSATDMIKQLMYLDRIDTGKPVMPIGKAYRKKSSACDVYL